MSVSTQAIGIKAPFIVRTINGIGRALKVIGLSPVLNEEKMLAAARKKTGLSNFGDEAFREGLRVLIDSLEKEANLNTMGRLVASGQINDLLSNRLKMVEYRKKHPEIEQQKITQPLFIAGLPRTGTTILHSLLAQDPACRSPLSWEAAQPCPPESGEDKRIAQSEQQLKMLCKFIPGFAAIHPVGAEMPQECISLMAFNFTSVQFELNFDIPSYQSWYYQQDLVPTYEYHKQILQLLQYNKPGKHWALKTPPHLGAIGDILKAYPDARIVQTHRDPTRVMASVSSLYYALRGLCTDYVDPYALGKLELATWSKQLNMGLEARKAVPEKAGQFFDLQFEELLDNPIACVKRLYQHFEMDFSAEAEKAMRDYMRDNQRAKHGHHHYTLEMFGLNKADIDEAFRKYREYFNIKSSNR